MTEKKQALISVSDKTGIVKLAQTLVKFGYQLISTGGTARKLLESGLEVTEISDYTGFPEMLDGRVKTLHPRVHAGILAKREEVTHSNALNVHQIPTIDLVIVNLYPFAETVASTDCSLDEAIENIDIGGPTMVRAAAKNWEHVGVITDPGDYDAVIKELQVSQDALLSKRTKFDLCQKAFSHTASYDANVSNYLTSLNHEMTRKEFPEQLNTNFRKAQDLRYGENPHQRAAFYVDTVALEGSIGSYDQLQGKELSFNNIADSDAAWECVKSFDRPACVIVKHANPCGVAIGRDAAEAYQKAFKTDPTSAFGGIIAFNTEVNEATSEEISKQFVEVVIAPNFTSDALKCFSKKENVRLLQIDLGKETNSFEYKRVGGGILIQSPDDKNVLSTELNVVTETKPTTSQLDDLIFAWKVAKFVKSNAIVFCRNGMTLGIGAGQMSRIDSARIAGIKAGNANLSLDGSVVASDAFFPFRDGLDVLKEAGASAVIHPGGSMRDEEVIKAANEHGMTMALTGVRHFRH